MSDSLWPHGPQPARLLCPWDSPGKNPGVGCHFLLQGIFLTQGWNLRLLHWQADSLSLNHLIEHPLLYIKYCSRLWGYKVEKICKMLVNVGLIVFKKGRQTIINKCGLYWWSSGKESACQRRGHQFYPWSGKIPHASGRLSPYTRATEPAHSRSHAPKVETTPCSPHLEHALVQPWRSQHGLNWVKKKQKTNDLTWV